MFYARARVMRAQSDDKDTAKNVIINPLRRVFLSRNKNFCIFVIQTTNRRLLWHTIYS